MNIDIRYSGFDDFVQYISSLLVICHSRFDVSDARSEPRSHTAGYAILQICGKFKESIDLSSMFIVNLNTASTIRGTRVCLDDYLVQEIIECFVVCLRFILSVKSFISYSVERERSLPLSCCF